MKYGIANTKGGSGGTSIPTINVSQSQWGSNSFTPTQEQLSLMLNNDVIIFKCDYIGKESVMQKIRWDGIYSDSSLTPQTTTIFLSPSILTGDENDNISGITQLMIVIPQNSQTVYVNSIGTGLPQKTSGVYLVSGTLTEDNGEYYFEYGDIDIDDSVLKYGDLLIYTSSNNATKIYMVDYIDDENEYVYVVEKASIGGGSQLYQHRITIIDIKMYLRFEFYDSIATKEIETITQLNSWLLANGYDGSSASRRMYLICGNVPVSSSLRNIVWIYGISGSGNDTDVKGKYINISSGSITYTDITQTLVAPDIIEEITLI